MDLKRREFRKTLVRVFFVSLILGVVAPWIVRFLDDYFFIVMLILFIYGFVEARIVFLTRAEIRDESTTRENDYLYAVLRFIAIMIPPVIVEVWLGLLLWVFSFCGNGYHG